MYCLEGAFEPRSESTNKIEGGTEFDFKVGQEQHHTKNYITLGCQPKYKHGCFLNLYVMSFISYSQIFANV